MENPYELLGISPDVDDDAEVKRRFIENEERVYHQMLTSDNKMDIKREIDVLRKSYKQVRNEDARFAFSVIESAMESLDGSLAVFEAKEKYEPTPTVLHRLLRRWARSLKETPFLMPQGLVLGDDLLFGRLKYVVFDQAVIVKAQTNVLVRNAAEPIPATLETTLRLKATFLCDLKEREFQFLFTAPAEAARVLLPLITRGTENFARINAGSTSTVETEEMKKDYIVICEEEVEAIEKKLVKEYRLAQQKLELRLCAENEIEEAALAEIGGKIERHEDDVIVVFCPCVVLTYHYEDQAFWAFVNLHTGSVCGNHPQSSVKEFLQSFFTLK